LTVPTPKHKLSYTALAKPRAQRCAPPTPSSYSNSHRDTRCEIRISPAPEPMIECHANQISSSCPSPLRAASSLCPFWGGTESISEIQGGGRRACGRVEYVGGRRIDVIVAADTVQGGAGGGDTTLGLDGRGPVQLGPCICCVMEYECSMTRFRITFFHVGHSVLAEPVHPLHLHSNVSTRQGIRP